MKYLHMTLVLLTVLLTGNAVLAEVPGPVIPKGNADKCVLPTQKMRLEHMEKILHQRDDTMRKGIRTKRFSLKKCISCHVVKDDAGKAVTIKDERHFCNSCHKFASVKIDCFECHASTPTGSTASTDGGKQ